MTSGMGLVIRNVVFDLDGTLIDSRPGIESCLRQALEIVEPGQELPPVETLIGPPVREMITSLLPGRDAGVIVAAETAFRGCYDEGGWRMTEVYEGANEMLRRLADAGVSLFVLTNKPAGPTRVILDSLGWHDRFDAVLCQDSVTPPFYDKATAMEHLLEQWGLDRARTLMVGDSADDARAAFSSGIAFAAACWGYGPAATEPGVECLLASLVDLPALVGLDG